MGIGAIHLKQQSKDARRLRRTCVCLALTLIGASLGLLSLRTAAPELVWNHTESLPVGLYRITRTPAVRGDIVVIAPAARLRETLDTYSVLPAGQLLLKTLAAANGDIICRDGASITINGAPAAIARARTGARALPAWTGCQALGEDEILALAPHPLSFDGRYFGAIDAGQVIGRAIPLLTFPHREMS